LKTLLFTVVFAAICTCVAMAPLPAHADWDPVADAMKSLTPEQRAMIEKQAGVKIGDLMKQSQPAVKK
jgi:hypothetical protein